MASQSTERRGGLRLPPAIIRLHATLVGQGDGCMVRLTNRNQAGYSRMTVGGRQVLVHRLMWEHCNGPIPEGMAVCHTCDNPPCCNPDHLFLGTIADNNRDMWSKGRGKVPSTASRWRKLSPGARADILHMWTTGSTKGDIAQAYGVTRQAIHYLIKRDELA